MWLVWNISMHMFPISENVSSNDHLINSGKEEKIEPSTDARASSLNPSLHTDIWQEGVKKMFVLIYYANKPINGDFKTTNTDNNFNDSDTAIDRRQTFFRALTAHEPALRPMGDKNLHCKSLRAVYILHINYWGSLGQ